MVMFSGWVVQRCTDLLSEIRTFLSTRNEEHKELSFDAWLLDRGSVTDLTTKLPSILNSRGKKKLLSCMISPVNSVKAKLCVCKTHLNNRKTTHFPNMEERSQTIKDMDHPLFGLHGFNFKMTELKARSRDNVLGNWKQREVSSLLTSLHVH